MKLIAKLLLVICLVTHAPGIYAIDKSLIKAIIFDCDGTLIDTEEVQYQGWVYAFKMQGQELSRELFLSWMIDLAGHPRSVQCFAERAEGQMERECASILIQDFKNHVKIYWEQGYPPVEGTVNFLHQLFAGKHEHGLKIGLASGNTKPNIIHHLTKLDVVHYFDVIVSGHSDMAEYTDPEGTNKPKPYVYLEAAKRLGVDPRQCIAIEDSKVGAAAAIAAGCITVVVPTSVTASHDFSEADLILTSFSGISLENFLAQIEK